MIQMQTMVDVADNTGPKQLKMIRVLGSSNRRFATLGDIIVGSIRPRSAFDNKKQCLAKGVVVRVKKKFRRSDGSYVRFDKNAVVLVDDDGNPRGTRIFGAVARELRAKNFMKIISLAAEVV